MLHITQDLNGQLNLTFGLIGLIYFNILVSAADIDF